MKIGFDLDNTLINTSEALIQHVAGMFKWELPADWQNSYDYHLEEYPWHVKNYFLELAYKGVDILYGIKPEAKLICLLKELRKDHDLYIITVRSSQSLQEMTKYYFNKHFYFFNKVLFSHTKFEYINNYEIDIFVDDLYDNLKIIEKHTNAKTILIDKFYNRQHAHANRAIDIYDAIDKIKGIVNENSGMYR